MLALVRYPFGIDAYTDWWDIKMVAPNINTESSMGTFADIVVKVVVCAEKEVWPTL
jgi:D-arabinose 5-phosphate isomerase GutQ